MRVEHTTSERIRPEGEVRRVERGTVVDSIFVQGNQRFKRRITASDPDREGARRLVPAGGIEPTA